MGNFNVQNTYQGAWGGGAPIKHRYCENPAQSYNFLFKIKMNGEFLRVCKKSFLSVHGLQNSRSRINDIIKGIKSNNNLYFLINVENIRQDKKNFDHIKSIPRYMSHYSRRQNPNKDYLDCDITIRVLYLEYYKEFYEKRSLLQLNEDKYKYIFCEEFNIGSKFPKSDKCSTCDNLENIIKKYWR